MINDTELLSSSSKSWAFQEGELALFADDSTNILCNEGNKCRLLPSNKQKLKRMSAEETLEKLLFLGLMQIFR